MHHARRPRRDPPFVHAMASRATLVALVALVAGALAAGCTPDAGLKAGATTGGDSICGSGCTVDDCNAAEAGLEFFHDAAGNPQPILDFEANPANPLESMCTPSAATPTNPGANPYVCARFMYTYVDGSSKVEIEDAKGNLASTPTYQPPARPATRCPSATNQNELHITGGPFLGWGGGMGVSISHMTGAGLNTDSQPGLCRVSPLPYYCPPPQFFGDTVSQSVLDMSQWDGVAFWARRGEESQPLLRVLIGDKFTDDDLSYYADLDDTGQVKKYCERIRDCSCLYQNAVGGCSFYSDRDANGNAISGIVSGGGFFCGPPGSTPGPDAMSPTINGTNYSNTCNVTRCNDPYSAFPNNGPDPKFANKPCAPYVFRNGTQSSFCFDPATEAPAAPDQQCGDFWTFPVHLTTEWQFYTVPFSVMYQQGWAKKAPYFDTKSVSVVRFTWDSGNIDYYIDDLRFYRKAR
jgi:hypothetical protein